MARSTPGPLQMREYWALVVIFVIAIVPHVILLPLSLYHDDTAALRFLLHSRVHDFFTSPETIRNIGSISFTPLLYLSLSIDYQFWELNGWGYSLHNALSYFLLGLSLYLFFRTQRFAILYAVLCASAILLLPSVVSISAWASTRHYLEGMIYSLLSLCCLSLWLSRKGMIFLFLSLLLYFFAILCKEIYLPLIFPAILMARLTLRKILQVGFCFLSALAVYFALRIYLMGNVVEGNVTFLPRIWQILAYLPFCWPRFTALSVDIDFYSFKALSLTFLSHVIFFASLYMSWHRHRLLGIVTYTFFLLLTVIVIAPVLSNDQFNFAFSHDLRGNRFIFPFAVMLFSLFFLLLHSHQTDTDYGVRRHSIKLLVIIAACMAFAGISQAGEWRRIKLSHQQWRAALDIAKDKQAIFIGPCEHLADISNLASVESTNPSFRPHTLGRLSKERLNATNLYQRVFLVLPGHPVRSAASTDELLQWIADYHRSCDPLNLFLITNDD